MPLHRLYVPPTLYTPEERSAIAEAITSIYVGFGLPPFYVIVVFVDVPKQNYFVGGKPTDQFLRIVIHHLVRQFPE
jgi:phenylpyruvate tautomerase PptA (4-oxalocrotonate tautomerase family)